MTNIRKVAQLTLARKISPSKSTIYNLLAAQGFTNYSNAIQIDVYVNTMYNKPLVTQLDESTQIKFDASVWMNYNNYWEPGQSLRASLVNSQNK